MGIVSPAEMLSVYALTLMIIGALAYQAAPPNVKAISSIYMGNGGAVVCFLLAVGARDTTLERGQSGYIPMMICVHLAFVFPILYGAVVGWRLVLAWNVPAKAYLRPYFLVIIGMSILTAAVVYASKPKKSTDQTVPTPDKGTHQNVDSNQSGKTTTTSETIRRRQRATAM